MEAHDAVTPNWFCISFGINVAKPEVAKPSPVPANVINMNVGFDTIPHTALGNPFILLSLQFLCIKSFSPFPPCTCETLVALTCLAAR